MLTVLSFNASVFRDWLVLTIVMLALGALLLRADDVRPAMLWLEALGALCLAAYNEKHHPAPRSYREWGSNTWASVLACDGVTTIWRVMVLQGWPAAVAVLTAFGVGVLHGLIQAVEFVDLDDDDGGV